MLREATRLGVNIGQENSRSYDLRMTITPPKARELPSGKLFAPARTLIRGLVKLRPSVQFSGSFNDVHDPGIRQPTDPTDIRSVSNGGKWDFRLDIPFGDAFKSIFPERKYSQSERDRLVSRQAALENQNARLGGRGGTRPDPQPAPADTTSADPDAVGEGRDGTVFQGGDLTPEEQRRREGERLLEAAEEQLERDREAGRLPSPAAPVAAEGSSRISPAAVFRPLLNALRNTTPIKVTYTTSKGSSYARLKQTADFWYLTGLVNTLDVGEDQYAAFASDERQNLSLSTTSKVSRDIALDVKYSEAKALRNQIGSITEDFKQDWPDAQISVSGIEKWGLFGGKADDTEAGWFRSSNVNLSYKYSRSVNNYTPAIHNPRFNTTISPRWTMNFHSGLTATLNATRTNDTSLSNGVNTELNRNRYGLNLRHQFRADTILSRLGLYRPGSSQSISMDIDLAYTQDRTDRLNPNGVVTAPTGTTSYSANPRFSVQVTRNLNAAVRFIFSRSKNIASNQSTTTLGLGLEATFVF
jgi:hypothetical protein